MNRKVFWVIVLLVLCPGAAPVFAQQGKKKVAESKTNVQIVANVDSLTSADSLSVADSLFITDTSTTTRYFLFPEFFSYWPIKKADTIIRHQCYDAQNSYINVDTLHNIDDVRHIQFVKIFTNFLHTYIDTEGKPRPSSATKTIYKYDKTDNDTWKAYDLSSGYVSELKEFRSEIVRRDTTTLINPITKGKQLTIRKYYKTQEQKKKGELEQDK